MSKEQHIRSESELVHEFQKLIASEKDLPWLPEPKSTPTGRIEELEVSFDGRRIAFKPYYAISPSTAELQSQLEPDGLPSIIVTPRLNERILEFCRDRRLSAIDLNGRAYIRANGLLIDRQAIPGRHFRFALEPRNVYVGKSVRIVRALLTDRDCERTQSEIIRRTGATSGLVSRVVNHLLRQGFLEKLDYRRFRLREPLALLDDWAQADIFAHRTRTVRYTGLGSPTELADKLQALFVEHGLDFAFTQWFAGWARHPYTEPLIVSAYVASLPADSLLQSIGLRPASESGNVWLHHPDDEGVLFEKQEVKGRVLVSDAQIYLDLLKTGLRGPDQAQALREWSGFLRP